MRPAEERKRYRDPEYAKREDARLWHEWQITEARHSARTQGEIIAQTLKGPAPTVRRKAGPPAKHDWPLVAKLAVQAVKGRYYADSPPQEPKELIAHVAEQCLLLKGYDLDEINSDLRKYCAAVLEGFRDS
jgi:hypothetical protein